MRRLLSQQTLLQTLPFQTTLFSEQSSARRACSKPNVRECISDQLDCILGASSSSDHSSATEESTQCLHSLVSLLRSADRGQYALIEAYLDPAGKSTADPAEACNALKTVLLHSLAVAGTAKSQSLLTKAVRGHFKHRDCLIATLSELHRVQRPMDELFDAVLSLASEAFSELRHSPASAAALLALSSMARNSKEADPSSPFRAADVSLLRDRLSNALNQDQDFLEEHTKYVNLASRHFTEAPHHMQVRLLGHVKHLHGAALLEEWQHASAAERDEWREETIGWIAIQVHHLEKPLSLHPTYTSAFYRADHTPKGCACRDH